jgi:ribA/ribD-fused uncharacterized protein
MVGDGPAHVKAAGGIKRKATAGPALAAPTPRKAAKVGVVPGAAPAATLTVTFRGQTHTLTLGRASAGAGPAEGHGGGDVVKFSYRGPEQWRCLSNLFRCTIKVNGAVYASLEAAFQHTKARLGTKPKDASFFIGKHGPRAKAAGSRRISPLDADQLRTWDQRKVEVMLTLLWCKFVQNPDCRAVLLNTGDQELLEWTKSGQANMWNTNQSGKGGNVVGQLLQIVRARMRQLPAVDDADATHATVLV